ncbi:FAD-dependent oxidoreductase [Methylopila sp. M107]|uniref:FAD-dependent oxidoreductase n=1 Tax=Methylopila sp. M107 TaxID=1101190 RepID=UPI000373EBDF|nr:FAD-dependent oxidoreductase [Methylopila sp. M107]
MTGPFRIAPSAGQRFGALIDRSEPVGFRLGAAVQNGFYGDTLASALLAAGVFAFGVSPILGRPRGPMALDIDDAAVLALQDAGAWRTIRAGDANLTEGLRTRLAEPGLGATALRRLTPQPLPEDRALPIPQQALERLRRMLPLPAPRLPRVEPEAPARRAQCDALVIGAGLAGLAAASALKAAGLDVRIVEAESRAGGIADLYEGTIDGELLAEWARARAAAFAEQGRLALGATAISIGSDGAVTVVEGRRRDGSGPGVRVISAGAVILATGFRERPMAFSGNDRPGVVFAGAARAWLRRHAVAPGRRVLVATTGDEGYRTAMDLREAGVAVDFVIDQREAPEGPAVEMAKALGAPVSLSSVVTAVEFGGKPGVISAARIRNRFGDGASAAARTLECDALVVSGGFAPRDELARASGLSAEQGLHVASIGPNAITAVAGGWTAGVSAAAGLGREVDVAAPLVKASADEFGEAPDILAMSAAAPGDDACFVDIAADVTFEDLARVMGRLGAAPRAAARRLGLGGGADGGRLSADLPALALNSLGIEDPRFGEPSAGRPTLALMAARANLKGG